MHWMNTKTLLRLGKNISLEYKLADLWVGLYPDKVYLRPINHKRQWINHLWICLLPCLPIHITWKGGDK